MAWKWGHTRTELLVLDGGLHLSRELDHRIDLLVALFALFAQRLERLVHRVRARQVVVQELLLDWEARLDGFLSRPVLAMSLALDLCARDA